MRSLDGEALHHHTNRLYLAAFGAYQRLPQRAPTMRSVFVSPFDSLRDRLAKKAKKERERQGKGGRGGGGVSSGAGTAPGRTKKKGPKPKMTKEERRAKYTQK